MFDLSNYLLIIYYDSSNALVLGKMKDKTAGVPFKYFAGLKQKVNFILVSNSRKYKKAKDVNNNLTARQFRRRIM